MKKLTDKVCAVELWKLANDGGGVCMDRMGFHPITMEKATKACAFDIWCSNKKQVFRHKKSFLSGDGQYPGDIVGAWVSGLTGVIVRVAEEGTLRPSELERVRKKFQEVCDFRKKEGRWPTATDADLENRMLYSKMSSILEKYPKEVADMKTRADKYSKKKLIDGYSRAGFENYLETTLIPDLERDGFDATAQDFKTALKFMKGEDKQ